MKRRICLEAVVIAFLLSRAAFAAPLGTAFTYQGQLKHNGAPVEDSMCYFTFALWSHPSCDCGLAAGPPLCPNLVGSVDRAANVNNGLFTVQLDFGAAPGGQAIWLQTGVCCASNPVSPTDEANCLASKVALSPCQPVNAVPYALGVRLPMNEALSGDASPALSVTHASQGDAIKGSSNGCTAPGCISGAGVTGENTADGDGVRGLSVNGYGMKAYGGLTGVYGESIDGYGVRAYSANADGILGQSDSGNGVQGVSYSGVASGVYGENNGQGYGVAGRASDAGTAILGDNPSPTGWAGYFGGKVYADAGYYSGLTDIAERIESIDPLEPGDVVEIDPDHRESFRRAATPYSPLTAGIVSTAPAVILGSRGEARDGTGASGAILALAGRVPVKVTAANGPIRIGDPLTTSSVPGHAMRCDDRAKCLGAVVAKALENLDAGTGIVIALVTLQ